MLGNYFKPTPKVILKISLAMKGFIGTVSAAAFFDGNKNAAFWFLVAGAAIDFIIQCIDVKPSKTNATLLVLAVMGIGLVSCKTTRSVVRESIDSTWVEYKSVDVPVNGASVKSAVNLDSLLSTKKAVYVQPGIQRGIELVTVTDTVTVVDTTDRVTLKYWKDTFGKLNIECSSKDETIKMLVAEVNRLKHRKETVTKMVKIIPWYSWVALALGVLLIVASIFKR